MKQLILILFLIAVSVIIIRQVRGEPNKPNTGGNTNGFLQGRHRKNRHH